MTNHFDIIELYKLEEPLRTIRSVKIEKPMFYIGAVAIYKSEKFLFLRLVKKKEIFKFYAQEDGTCWDFLDLTKMENTTISLKKLLHESNDTYIDLITKSCRVI